MVLVVVSRLRAEDQHILEITSIKGRLNQAGLIIFRTPATIETQGQGSGLNLRNGNIWGCNDSVHPPQTARTPLVIPFITIRDGNGPGSFGELGAALVTGRCSPPFLRRKTPALPFAHTDFIVIQTGCVQVVSRPAIGQGVGPDGLTRQSFIHIGAQGQPLKPFKEELGSREGGFDLQQGIGCFWRRPTSVADSHAVSTRIVGAGSGYHQGITRLSRIINTDALTIVKPFILEWAAAIHRNTEGSLTAFVDFQ